MSREAQRCSQRAAAIPKFAVVGLVAASLSQQWALPQHHDVARDPLVFRY